ncbi:emopamil-binding protein [Mycobacterium sp. 852013-51886_SCH5428379]|uniref:emopamil-binding protein n=2 Tax=Mycobacteriaceae TaxID=1762 RepID=UPI0007FEC16F|nr:emopamil-binding protein [Mycobacterium sp. 852013-51886_SCH5428379]MCK0176566.1 emopamil-binding protein [Mycolicibacterium sp. F2034L]OBB56170.1 emopamil-binding protein [Mycobacterium sp. 852013-51886_SCH5428379]
MTTVGEREPNLAQPWAPHRLRIYTWTGIFTFAVFLAVTIGVSVGVIAPTFTTDVVVNLIFGVPVILLPFVILWDAPGERRTRLDKAAELSLFYMPYTAGSQIGYELMFLIGHPLGFWAPTDDPGWKWLWWQYALADTRYVSGNPWIFALEVVGVLTGCTVFVMWTRLIRTDLAPEARIKALWIAFTGCAILMSSTAVYFLAEVGAGFENIGQGAWGLWFKFVGENIPFMVLPPLVLYSLHLQIDYLTRRAGPQTARRV